MKIVIAGGSGQLGQILTRGLRARGHEVVILSRRADVPAVEWDGRTLGPWARELDGAAAVINLAGRSVDCRYGPRQRREILRSRVDSTRVIGEAIAAAAVPPRVWLQASTATIYAHRFDAPNDEHTGILGGSEAGAPRAWRFSTGVAKAWEAAIDDAHTPRTRKVKLRTSIVMSASGGPFALLLRHIRLGFGRFGNGRQWMSWIHERDFFRAVHFLLLRDDVEGAVNVTAPDPLPNAAFIDILAEAWGRTFTIPSVRPLLDIGAFVMRTEPELVLKSRRVVPARLLEHGFTFEFEQWRGAARELVARTRQRQVARAAAAPQW